MNIFILMNILFLFYKVWAERCKQILKKWRALPTDKKAPYLTQARDNRAAVRMKKTQQVINICAETRKTDFNYRIYFSINSLIRIYD